MPLTLQGGSRGEWAEEGGDQGLEGGPSASSLVSERLEESLSAASLAEVGSDWQLAVDSLTSSMDSSVSIQPPSLPSLSAPPPPPSSSDQQAAEEEQVTGESAATGSGGWVVTLDSAGSISTEV